MDHAHWINESGVDWSQDKFKESAEEIVREFNIGDIPDEMKSPGNMLFKKTIESMGIEPRYVPTGRKNCIYCGLCGLGNFCRHDSKPNVLGYVARAEKNGVKLIPDVEVEKVEIERKGEKGIVRGVVFRQQDGTIHQAYADKVLVSCGAYGTPILCLLYTSPSQRD